MKIRVIFLCLIESSCMNVNESRGEFMVYPMCQYSWNEIFSIEKRLWIL